MTVMYFERLYNSGLQYLKDNNTLSALSCFEKIINFKKHPSVLSFYAFCIAKERGQFNQAISFCEEAISKEYQNALHYLNLGKVHLLNKNKLSAIKVFREGLKYEANPEILNELNRLGTRERIIIPFLKRSNLVNQCLGIILKWLNLR